MAVLETVRSKAPTVVAADGGARHAVEAGFLPDAVIGDFDSLGDHMQATLPAHSLHRIGEQDSTDFEKCLSRIRAPLVVGLGFMGPRLDHQLAAFHALMRCADQRCVLVGETQVAFLCPPELHLALPVGALVSVFPLCAVSARSKGVEWPLDGLDLAPGRVIGTSNRAAADQVSIYCDRPGLLVILPGQQRAAALAALLTAPVPWPAPGR
ncbi:thiamine diphosphokinase [Aestuariivita sp.]|jgi:thiamine pyrophosphokinase|uniref:thiamine diphosphokinase n=1 Tax=Aestuariivita sp. TaxID=1872407 RepID=UPI0025C5B6DC|nr:thiamine diphosphokinase [Aestuariivita sp.]